MGGTSFDVSVVRDGQVALMTQGDIDGLPVRLPMVEIRTIGAGGGSIAAVDTGGRLTVGPRSAGARPGPACYGEGGTEPTVTDANIVLGRLDPAFFLGGAMALDVETARRASREHCGALRERARREAAGRADAGAGRLAARELGLQPRCRHALPWPGVRALGSLGRCRSRSRAAERPSRALS